MSAGDAPFHFEPQEASDEELDALNREQGRTGVRRLLPFEKAVKGVESVTRVTPEREESLLAHPDERLGIWLAHRRKNKGWGERPHAFRLADDAAEQALASGEVWSPYLDALFQGPLVDMAPKNVRDSDSDSTGRPYPTAKLDHAIRSWLGSADAPDEAVARLLDFEAPCLLELVAESREPSPAISSKLRGRFEASLEQFMDVVRSTDPGGLGPSTLDGLPAQPDRVGRILSGTALTEEDRGDLHDRLSDALLELLDWGRSTHRQGSSAGRSRVAHSPPWQARQIVSEILAQPRFSQHLSLEQLHQFLELPDNTVSRARLLMSELERLSAEEIVAFLYTHSRDFKDDISEVSIEPLLDRLLAEEKGEGVPRLETLFSHLSFGASRDHSLRVALEKTQWREELVQLVLDEGNVPVCRHLASRHPDPEVRGRALGRLQGMEWSMAHVRPRANAENQRQIGELVTEEAFSSEARVRALEPIIDGSIASKDVRTRVRLLIDALEDEAVPPEIRTSALRTLAHQTTLASVRDMLAASSANQDPEVVECLAESSGRDVLFRLLQDTPEDILDRDRRRRLLERLAHSSPSHALRLVELGLDGTLEAWHPGMVSEKVVARILAAPENDVRERAISRIDELQPGDARVEGPEPSARKPSRP